MKLTTVPDSGECVTVTASAEIEHRCPHVEEVDKGTVTMSWMVTEQTIELHSLAEYVRSWKDVRISHEELTATIQRDLLRAGVEEAQVRATWQTAGLSITTDTRCPS